MIESKKIEIDGRKYEWRYDPEVSSPEACWSWSDIQTSLTLTTNVIATLNRFFIDNPAPGMAARIDDSELKRFQSMLRAMGASDADFEKPGMERLLAISNPERLRDRQFDKLPPAMHSPFNCPVIRDWVFDATTIQADVPRFVSCIGHGPFEVQDFEGFLASRNVKHLPAELPIGHLVLGREGWDESEIDLAIDKHEGFQLRIYSQEMFVLALLCGCDPFYASPDVLAAFKSGHPGLEFVSQGWTGWVSTYVPKRGRSSSSRSIPEIEREPESPLRVLGYSVSKTGPNYFQRQKILASAFTEKLPWVGTREYMLEWGQPNTPERLKKIATFIAATCRTQRNRQKPSKEAISNWEADLDWLKREYYHGHFSFQWPDTNS